MSVARRRGTHQICQRGDAGFFGFEPQQRAQLGHVVLEIRVLMPTDGSLPYLVVTVNGLLRDDEEWLKRRDQRMGRREGMPDDEPHEPTINESGAITQRMSALSSKERDALDEAVTVLYFTDSSKSRDALVHYPQIAESRCRRGERIRPGRLGPCNESGVGRVTTRVIERLSRL